ncbi:MAG: 2-amino-4-hydroxy-6-hydroxymethyldihydropteridine diphosphokinase [Candidatus Hydrogenedentes bacterium]|nr:2-amino-4-hydroxy-6-hydroxymethyldihydropteridine diphosphokinase [Candidatus Hydrogenedentota bacterium]
MRVHLSLGSNLGDRRTNLSVALTQLDRLERVRVLTKSELYETEPIGIVDQPAFLNMAAEIETDLEPLELLDAVKQLEAQLGRVPGEKWGPRLIDIDIILWGERVESWDRLVLPHAEFRNRAFVLVPLREIAPDAVDPVTGMTVAELAESPAAHGKVARVVY